MSSFLRMLPTRTPPATSASRGATHGLHAFPSILPDGELPGRRARNRARPPFLPAPHPHSHVPLSITLTAFSAPVGRPVAGRAAVQMVKSQALPMAEANPVIAGLPGSVGFDPLMLATPTTLKWMIEAELKHGRVAMLAVLGWVAVDLGLHFPLAQFEGLTSLTAHDATVKSGDMFRLFLYASLAETLAFGKTLEMMMGGDKIAGDLGFDPLGFKSSPDYAKLQVKEIKNGRLAMLAFSGIVTQAALSGKGIPYY
ncbi:chlorophyll a/b-binding protein domain-containing protein [Pavlovales sp. CCMP2436]|nr:chlorophyll a/b-binding protein domain-containing protein [Pavlovales sp. CCMP2436]